MKKSFGSADYYELNTDEFYAYEFRDRDLTHMNYEVILSDPADPEYLTNALILMYYRFPYFKTMLSKEQNPERFVLRMNPHPVKIFNSEDYISLENPGLNGHMISVGYFGKSIKFRISHLLTDGVGARNLLQTLLIFYFQMRYENRTMDELSQTVPTPDPEVEYGNPFDGLCLPDIRFNLRRKESFMFSENDTDESKNRTVCFSVLKEPFLDFSRSQESSVAAVASWIMIRAIFSFTRTELPVTAAVPLDARKHLNCPKTLRNCNTTIYLSLTPDFLKKDRYTQLTALRAQMFLQADGSNVVPLMNRSRDDWLKASKCDTIDKRTDYYSMDDNLSFYPIVSYIGTFELPEYREYYESISSFVPVLGSAGILTLVTGDKDVFHFHINMNLKNSEEFEKTIFRILDENRILYRKTDIRYH
ncbi:MAG: hypothetical protein K5886_06990 [Lachnospiraceae bacterium]|nr:hypothetical protein [Lachnospiraceae bacterium]